MPGLKVGEGVYVTAVADWKIAARWVASTAAVELALASKVAGLEVGVCVNVGVAVGIVGVKDGVTVGIVGVRVGVSVAVVRVKLVVGDGSAVGKGVSSGNVSLTHKGVML